MDLTQTKVMEMFGIDLESLVDRDYIRENFMVLEYTKESPNCHKGGTDRYKKTALIPKEEMDNIRESMPVLKVQSHTKRVGKRTYPKLVLGQLIESYWVSISDDYTLRPVLESDLDDLQDWVNRVIDSSMDEVRSIIGSVRDFDSELKQEA